MTQRRLRTDGGCKAKAMPHVSPTPGCHQPCREWGCVSSHTSKSTSPVHGLLTSPPLLTTRTHGTQASGFLGGRWVWPTPKLTLSKVRPHVGNFLNVRLRGGWVPKLQRRVLLFFFFAEKYLGPTSPSPLADWLDAASKPCGAYTGKGKEVQCSPRRRPNAFLVPALHQREEARCVPTSFATLAPPQNCGMVVGLRAGSLPTHAFRMGPDLPPSVTIGSRICLEIRTVPSFGAPEFFKVVNEKMYVQSFGSRILVPPIRGFICE